jgi:hypothetical protein
MAKLHANWRSSRPVVSKPAVTSKVCGGCKQEKPASDFYADRKRKDGLQCQCKSCTAQSHERWRAKKRQGEPEPSSSLLLNRMCMVAEDRNEGLVCVVIQVNRQLPVGRLAARAAKVSLLKSSAGTHGQQMGCSPDARPAPTSTLHCGVHRGALHCILSPCSRKSAAPVASTDLQR